MGGGERDEGKGCVEKRRGIERGRRKSWRIGVRRWGALKGGKIHRVVRDSEWTEENGWGALRR